MDVLVADDDRATRLLLETYLVRWGYDVVTARDGLEAWAILQSEAPPKLALLDWMMPGVDGLELCQRLKTRPDGRFLYTILLTSRANKGDAVTGLDAGAHDFIAKPFDQDDLRSRLAVGARTIAYERALVEKKEELAHYAAEMERLAEERARQLVHAGRMATLGTMSAGIAHEINNPLTFIFGNIDLLRRTWKELEEALHRDLERGPDNAGKVELILGNTPKIFENLDKGVQRVARIVKGLRRYGHKGESSPAPCQVNGCVEEALELCRGSLKSFTVERFLHEDLPEIEARGQEIEQTLVNLFVNAADAMKHQDKGTLRIVTEPREDGVRILVEDTGPGIPSGEIESIWEPFFSTKAPGEGTGLGLSITRGIIEEHGGSIRAEDGNEGGVRFVIELPFRCRPPASQPGVEGARSGNATSPYDAHWPQESDRAS